MNQPFLSVVIPMYNEARRITATLDYITAYLKHQDYTWEIIVVNDGSSDSTGEKIKPYISNSVRLVDYSQNRGKGYAVNQGLRSARGTYILICDADNATPFEQIERLMSAMNRTDIAIGSRYVHGSHIVLKQPLSRIIGSRIGNFLIQLLILPGIKDTQCGFKLFTFESVQKIIPLQTVWRWGFDMELLVIAREFNLRIIEVPVDWHDRTGSKVHSSRAFTFTLKELIYIWQRKLEGHYRPNVSHCSPPSDSDGKS